MSKFAILFMTVFFGGIIVALAYTPVAAFVLYQLVYFLNPDERWWSASIPGLRYSMVTVLLMLLVLAMKWKELNERSSWQQQPVIKWLVALVVIYYLMYIPALNVPAHDRFVFDFLKLIVIVIVAYKLIGSERALNAVLWAYIVGALYIGYVARSVGRNSFGRVEGIGMVDTGGDSNYTAAALVPAATLLMYFAWMGNKKIKFLCVFCGAYIANALILINSRGAFLGAVCGVLFFLLFMLFSRYQRKNQRPMAIFILVLGLGGAYYLTDETFWERMQTLEADEQGRRGGDGRMQYWFATLDMMKDYPMGLGIGGYNAISQRYLFDHEMNPIVNKSVHSIWFQLLSETGWQGVFVFGGLLFSAIRLSYKTKKFLLAGGRTDEYFQMLALEGALLSFLVAATFINRIRAEVLYWLILFIASAANVYYLQYVNNSAVGAAVSYKERGLRADKIPGDNKKEPSLS